MRWRGVLRRGAATGVPLVSPSASSSAPTSSTAASAAAAAATATTAAAQNERSLLRNLIPMRVYASGPASTSLRHAFLQQEKLIHRFLGSLEQVPLPSLPRVLLAEGFQRLLEGESPQRELRELFEEAEMEVRKMLLQLDVSSSGAAVYHGAHADPTERAAWEAVQGDPLSRVLAYELRAEAGSYARRMSISSDPYTPASVLVRTVIASDVRTDDFLVKMMLEFDEWPRNVETGERQGAQPMPSQIEEMVKELLLLERDAFGVFRFDPRGDNHHLVQTLKLSDIVKTPKSFCVLLDSVIRNYGNFSLTSEEIYKNRWLQYTLHCGQEDHRVDLTLPLCETVVTKDAVTGNEIRLLARYDEPICARHKASSKEEKGNFGHTEVFELAIENKNRSYWEKFFLDR